MTNLVFSDKQISFSLVSFREPNRIDVAVMLQSLHAWILHNHGNHQGDLTEKVIGRASKLAIEMELAYNPIKIIRASNGPAGVEIEHEVVTNGN